jgi:hypothetical protein
LAPTPTLETQVREFAAAQSELLNRTIANGVRLSAVIPSGRDASPNIPVACGISTATLSPHLVALTLGRKAAGLYLGLAYRLTLDPEGEYLTVAKSYYSIIGDPGGRTVLARWDYEREPSHKYFAAHFQVEGSAPAFDAATEHARDALGRDCPHRTLKDFHFPVGGRRYRPTLEDVIEFLILEELVDRRTGWERAIEEGRTRWEERQLRAAVRRKPEIARAELTSLDAKAQEGDGS